MSDHSKMRSSLREELSSEWFTNLNQRKILVITDGPFGDSRLKEGTFGESSVEIVAWDKLDLENFPLVEDLYFDLDTSMAVFGGEEKGGYLSAWLRFKSFKYSSPGSLVNIELYDKDMARAIRTICRNGPFLGTREHPYSDGEQGWNFYCFESGEFVYILYGTDIAESCFPIWFKVRKEKYIGLFDDLQESWRKHRKDSFQRRYGKFLGGMAWLIMRPHQ